MRTVTLKLPEDLDRALTNLAATLRLTRSAVLREALRAFTRDREGSVRSLAGDLAGSLNGPRDLSSSSDHLEGYGK